MNSFRKQLTAGFTPIELIIVVACLLILAALVLPALARAKTRSSRIDCVNNLKQVGLAYRTFALDNKDHYPMSLDVSNGGTLQFVGTGMPFMHYTVMSNELSTPKILVCPHDSTRAVATTFALSVPPGSPVIPFNNNANLSYFVGTEADERFPSVLLSGDRWLGTGGLQFRPSIQTLLTNTPLEWINSGHSDGAGNVGFADGSVRRLSSKELSGALRSSELATNRLEIP